MMSTKNLSTPGDVEYAVLVRTPAGNMLGYVDYTAIETLSEVERNGLITVARAVATSIAQEARAAANAAKENA